MNSLMRPNCADDLFTLFHCRSVIYTDPQRGYVITVITPSQFSCDTPNHLKFKGGYQGVFTGGVYVMVMEGVINNNKMLTM